jgi:DnaJ-like protein
MLQPRLRKMFRTFGKYPQKLPAKTLYDLLGVRPDDDAETLQSAFRDAAKAHHPDLNPGDPDASQRFRQIVTAYGILRNAERRGAYDRLLVLKRARHRAKLMRSIASDAIAIVALTVVVVGGYTLFADVLKTSVEAAKASQRLPKLSEIVVVPRTVALRMSSGSPPALADGSPAEIHVVEPAPTGKSRRGEPTSKTTRMELAEAPIAPSAVAPEAKSNEPLRIANRGPAPDSTGSKIEAAKAVGALDAGNGANHHKKNDEFNSLDQNKVRAVEPQFSSSQKDKSPSSNSAGSDEKLDTRTTAKLGVHTKRPATDRASVREAAVQSRDTVRVALASRNPSTCASSCSDHMPPVFGVGF